MPPACGGAIMESGLARYTTLVTTVTTNCRLPQAANQFPDWRVIRLTRWRFSSTRLTTRSPAVTRYPKARPSVMSPSLWCSRVRSSSSQIWRVFQISVAAQLDPGAPVPRLSWRDCRSPVRSLLRTAFAVGRSGGWPLLLLQRLKIRHSTTCLDAEWPLLLVDARMTDNHCRSIIA
jgi:hypothetical protein